MKTRARRRTEIGVVTSDRMDKTIAVRVDWLYQVPKYGKRIRRRTTYYAHDEANAARMGDRVEIEASRPLSKLKRWRLVRVVRQAAMAPVGAVEPGEELAARGLRPATPESAPPESAPPADLSGSDRP
jgi:small subunit ribosomal protein S17